MTNSTQSRPNRDRIARLVLDNADDFGIFTTDLEGCVTSWNIGAERLLGWSEDEMLGQDACVIFTPEDLAADACGMEMRTAEKEGRAVDERWHVKKDGSRFFASGLLMRIEDDGRHIGYLKILRDRSELREAQEERLIALEQSEARLRLALDAAKMAIWELDLQKQQLTPSAELAAFLNVSVDDLSDIEKVRANYHPDDRERVRSEGQVALSRGDRQFETEFRFYRGPDDLRWFLLRADVSYLEDGEPHRVLGALVDITHRKSAEEALRKLNQNLEEEVRARTSELLQAEESLRQSQKMEAIGQLTGGVAHDFNNLLTIIRSSVDLLRRPDFSEDRKQKYMTAISDTVDRAATLTSQLLAFARRQALAPAVFDVAAQTIRIADMLNTVTGARVRVDVDADCTSCFANADPTQFETALVNLAVNARDAMRGEGVLTIRVSTVPELPALRAHAAGEGTYVAVEVSDTGVGISPENLPRIFEPFFTTKAVGKGTGLGLAQVFGFAKQSGGDVQVESKVGAGSTFTLYLPQTADRIVPATGSVSSSQGPDVKRRILVVEDNVQVGEFATQLLEELGHSTVLAQNAHEALEVLGEKASEFDLVFTDIVMPGMSGIQLAKEVGRLYPGLRVILTSGYSDVIAREGTNGLPILQKPYSLERLTRFVQATDEGGAVT